MHVCLCLLHAKELFCSANLYYIYQYSKVDVLEYTVITETQDQLALVANS